MKFAIVNNHVEETWEVFLDGKSINCYSYDMVGYNGAQAVRDAVKAIAEQLGAEFEEEG